ncbi:MAG: hypothetical protein ACYTF3_11745, partial [Planctomycetota bacterium]
MRLARWRSSATALLLGLSLAAFGCDDGDSSATDAGAGGAGGGGAGGAGPNPGDEAFALRFWGHDDPVEVEDGRVPWVWGFQGGSMIRPAVVLPSGGPFEAGDDIRIAVEHRADPDAPELFRVEDRFRSFDVFSVVESLGDELIAGPLDDQLSGEDLTGVRMVLRVEVEGLDGAVERRLTLYDPGPPADPCLPFAPGLGDVGCAYAEVPGTIRLTEAPTPIEGACGTEMAGVFEPAPASEDCLAAHSGLARVLEGPLPISLGADTDCLLETGYAPDVEAAGKLSFIVQ